MTSQNAVVRFGAAHDADWLLARELIAPERVARALAAGDYLLAERDGARVGFVRLEYLWSTVPFIALIRVEQAERRQGVGMALLLALEAHLRAADHGWLLSSSQADEPAPQAWHRRMGFEECGVICGLNEGGVGEIFFRKRL